MLKPDLGGLKVAVLRAASQNANLCQLINQAGGRAMPMPMLDIKPAYKLAASEAIRANLNNYQLIIFVSANAASIASSALNLAAIAPAANSKLPLLATVGKASTQALQALTPVFGEVIYPEFELSGQGLLQELLRRYQSLRNWRVLIARGHSGSDKLSHELQQLGASSEYFCCYNLAIPAYSDCERQQFMAEFAAGNIDIISASSAQTLQNLTNCLQGGAMFDCPLLPISQNMALKAKDLGFKTIVKAAQNASDAAILDALHDFAKLQH